MNTLKLAFSPQAAPHLRRAGGVFVLLFLMAGQNGQEVVQASFLMIAAVCLLVAEKA